MEMDATSLAVPASSYGSGQSPAAGAKSGFETNVFPSSENMSTTAARGGRQLSVSGKGGNGGRRYGNGNGSNTNGNSVDPPLGKGSRGSVGGTSNASGGSRGGPRNAWSKPLQSAVSVAGNSGGSIGTANSSAGTSAPGSTTNSNNSTHSNTPSNESVAIVAAGDPERHMNDRLTFLLAKSIGCTAIVTVASGLRYKGILSGALTDSDLGVVLRFAEKTTPVPGIEEEDGSIVAANIESNSKRNGSSNNASSLDGELKRFDKLVITPKDCVDIFIENPVLTADVKSIPPTNSGINKNSGAFKTDTDISGRRNGLGVERELQRWTPDNSEDLDMTLEESIASTAGGWDQFSVNQQKFGVETTYDEHYYTTAIDKSHPEYHERARRAEQIASEITKAGHGGNVHLAEERGIDIDDSGLDEEDKYSGVDRRPQRHDNQRLPVQRLFQQAEKEKAQVQRQSPSPTSQSGPKKYTPPQFRAPTGVKGVPGVPYDPAIISSSLASPDGRLTPKNQTEAENQNESQIPSQAPVEPKAEVSITSSSSPNTTANTSTSTQKQSPSAGIEKELAGNFRQFVSVEVQRLNQKKQYLQKREKSERLHDFKKFSEDYKINTPVPPDLVPILAKGKDKQEEIVQRAAANAAAAHSPKTSPSVSKTIPVNATTDSPNVDDLSGTSPSVTTTVPKSTTPTPAKVSSTPTPAVGNTPTPTSTPAAAAPSHPPQPATTTASPDKPKFNFKVPGFKPNPSAHSFTPFGGAKGSPSPVASQIASPQTKQSATVPISMPGNTRPTANANTSPSFFNKQPGAKSLKGKFNPFLDAKAQHTGDDPFVIERAFATPPTWSSTVEKSYAEVLTSLKISSPRMGGFFPPGGAGGVISPRPSVTGFPPASSPMGISGSNLVGMMPTTFDEVGNPIMATSPPPIPGQMIPAGMVPMGYPQYVPQYGAPQYYGRPPQPMAFPMGYMPPQGGYGSPRMHQAVMVPAGQSGSGYYPPQPQFIQQPRSHHSNNNYTRRGSNGPNSHVPPPPLQNHLPLPPPPVSETPTPPPQPPSSEEK